MANSNDLGAASSIPDHPEDFLFPLNPAYASGAQSPQAKKQLGHQSEFLAWFATLGNDWRAADAAGVGRRTIQEWKRSDALGFGARYALAQASFGQYLEGLALDRVLSPTNNGRTGSDVLLIFLLNGNLPDKYRRDTREADDTAQRVLDRLRGVDRAPGGLDGPPPAPTGERAPEKIRASE